MLPNQNKGKSHINKTLARIALTYDNNRISKIGVIFNAAKIIGVIFNAAKIIWVIFNAAKIIGVIFNAAKIIGMIFNAAKIIGGMKMEIDDLAGNVESRDIPPRCMPETVGEKIHRGAV